MPTLTNKGNFIIGTTAADTGTEYSPKSLKVSFEAITTADSGRSDNGTMHIDWAKTKLVNIDIEMPTTTDTAKMSTLLNSVHGQKYYITYFDTTANAQKTIHAFTTTSASDCYSGAIGTNGAWSGIAFKANDIGDYYA